MSVRLTERNHSIRPVRDAATFMKQSAVTALTRDEEIAAFNKWRTDPVASAREAARNLIVRSFLPFILNLARKMAKSSAVDLDELIAQGNLALVVVMDRFDPSRGVRFITYLHHYAHRYMLTHLAVENTPLAGSPSFRTANHSRLRREAHRIRTCENPEAELEKLAKEMDSSVDRIRQMLALELSKEVSMDEEIKHRGHNHTERTITLHDLIASPSSSPEDQVASAEIAHLNARSASRVLDAMTPREALVVRRSIMSDEKCSLREIGEEVGVTREYVRQIKVIATEKARRILSL